MVIWAAIVINLKRRLPMLLAAFFATFLGIAVGQAGPYDGQSAPPGVERAMDADAAAAMVHRATGGKVLRVEPSNRDGNRGYRVRVLLEDGRVRVLNVDANTGRLSD